MALRSPLTFLLFLVFAPADGQDRGPLVNGDVRSIELAGAPDARIEHFRLDGPEAGGAALGVARYVAGPAPEGGLSIELDVRFFDPDVRVLHVETLRPDELKLVVREIRARGGRTVLLEWSRDDPVLRASDTHAGEVLRRDVDASGGALMPLFLLEQMRHGAGIEGPVRVFDPRSAGVETRIYEADSARAARRIVSARLEDGTAVGSYTFDADRLVELRWQAGGPVARAVERAEYVRLVHRSVHRETPAPR